MDAEIKPRMSMHLRIVIALFVLVSAFAVFYGFMLDGQPAITQPQLFWTFLMFGLAGSVAGGRLALRNDCNVARNLIGMIGSLVAWRVSYFPFMVVAGWKASLGEWLTFNTIGVSVVYPTFVLFLFLQHAGVGFIGAAAVARPQSPGPETGRLLFLRRLFHEPPRKLLWALACVALPVAGMVSFSTTTDFVIFNDGPTDELAVPPMSEPKVNPYEVIMNEYELSAPAWILAVNARLTYPLVPHSPWGRGIKGTLESLTLANPLATTRDRIDEHYQAYIAAHVRIHDPDAGANK